MNRKQLPIEVKRMVCTRIASGEWNLEAAAEATTYSVSSMRRWLERFGQPPAESGRKEEPQPTGLADPPKLEPELERRLRGVVKQHPQFGRRALREYLLRHHRLAVSERVLGRFLADNGLSRPASRRRTEQPPRRFEAGEPLELIQTDLFYIRRKEEGFFYGLTVLDDHSRMCLSVVVLEEQTGEMVLTSFREVVERWGVPRRVLTDRGTQFVSWRGRTRFQDYVEKELKAEHVVAATRHPQTLGKVERLHRTLREDVLTAEEGYETAAQAQGLLDRYVAWYNYVRPHQGLDGLTPADRFYGLAEPLRRTVDARTSWRPERGIFLAANLMGRRLVIAGEGPEALKLLWDEETNGGSAPILAGER